MCFLGLAKNAVSFAAVISWTLTSLCAQDAPKTEDESFDVEPPLLVKPWEQQGGSEASDEGGPEIELDAGKIGRRLEAAKKDAAAANRLVKTGILSKAEAEQRALRVTRLESALAKAQMLVAAQELATEKACLALGEATHVEVEVATATFAQAQAAAQSAEENYRRAQLENAALNLSRQRKLFSLGSALKSDVSRAEERLAKLQQDEEAPR